MQDRIAQAVQALKAAKSQGLSYYAASQSLLKQGFTQSEIEQASAQFTYTEVDPVATSSQSQGPNLNQAFAQGVVHQEAIDSAKQQLAHDAGVGLLAGRGRGAFVSGKILSDEASLYELKQKGSEVKSQTVMGQVPSLKTFVLYLTAANTFQLLVLVVFHFALLGSLIIPRFTEPGPVATLIEAMAYAAQLCVIINFALCLTYVLNKSFSRTRNMLTFTKLLVILSWFINLLTFNFLNVILGVYIYIYLNGVSDDVHLVQTGEMKLS